MCRQQWMAALCGVILCMASGCGTMFDGTTQDVTFTSDPPGATVTVDNMQGVTPVTLRLERGDTHKVTFQKEGYVTSQQHVDQNLNTWLIGSLCWGIIGIAIDCISGAAWELTPDAVFVKLNPGTGVAAAQPYTPPPARPAQPAPPVQPAPRPVAAPTPGPVARGACWAVVVGISEFKDSDFARLPFAAKGARDMSKLLLAQPDMGADNVRVLIDRDATADNIKDAFEGFLSKAGPDDVILVYWSGHGYPDPEDQNKVYFACYDTEYRRPWTGYRMDKVREALEEKKARNVIMMADTCHAGKLITRGERGVAGVAGYVEDMDKQRDIPRGMAFMVAADSDRKAIEHSSWSNGAFTYVMLKGLGGEADGYQGAGKQDGIITLGEIRAYLAAKLPTESAQVLGKAIHPCMAVTTGDTAINDLILARVPQR